MRDFPIELNDSCWKTRCCAPGRGATNSGVERGGGAVTSELRVWEGECDCDRWTCAGNGELVGSSSIIWVAVKDMLVDFPFDSRPGSDALRNSG